MHLYKHTIHKHTSTHTQQSARVAYGMRENLSMVALYPTRMHKCTCSHTYTYAHTYIHTQSACVAMEGVANLSMVALETAVVPIVCMWELWTTDAVAVYVMGIACLGRFWSL